MNQEMKNLESVFQNAFKEHKVQPSAGVLKKLKFKLWINEFLSFNLKKLNIYYVTAGIVGVSAISIPVLNSNFGSLKETAAVNTNIVAEHEEITEKENIVKEEIAEEVTKPEPAVEIEESSAASASFIPSSIEGCAPLQVEFKNKSKKASSYYWDFGDGTTSREVNPVHSYKQGGRYTAILTIESKDKSVATTEQNIFVLDRPTAKLDINIEKSDVKSKSIVFENNSKKAYDYIWNFGDEGTSTERNPVHQYNDYGIYNVNLVAIDENGCSDTAALVNKFIDKAYKLGFPFNFTPSSINTGNNGYYESADFPQAIFYPDYVGVKEYNLEITAPNGLKVFETTDVKQGWNGYIRGRIAPAGNYLWVATGVYENGKAFNYKGKVLVNRQSGVDYYGY